MAEVGYAFLRERLQLPIPPMRCPAQIAPVIRVGPGANGTLAVPVGVAPQTEDPLEHVLFALKHEGTDLLVLSHAMRRIPAQRMATEVINKPTGRFVRKAGFLWEHFNREQLPDVAPRGAYVPLLDPALYFTGRPRRDARWLVTVNCLGSLAYAPTVRRTATIKALLDKDLLGQADAFAKEIGPELLDRALAWAYLDETEKSFAIEREAPSADKAALFADLLKQAGTADSLNEAYLVSLQNAAMTNPLEFAVQYRTEQNWLRGPAKGVLGVTYVPPPPDLCAELMERLSDLMNDRASGLDPLVRAAIVSFGFVFIHPFMDGNGRLSRFLVHDVLGQSGRLPKGFVLPISIAMNRNEAQYLSALKSFSKPARDMWRVRWIDEGVFTFQPLSDDALYRFWDATECVEFLLLMAEQALEKDLREETRFLVDYDAALKEVEQRFDIRSNALTTLLLGAFQHNGVVSKNRRKQFEAIVPQAAFEFIEQVVSRRIRGN